MAKARTVVSCSSAARLAVSLLTLIVGLAACGGAMSPIAPTEHCTDQIDNNGDGLVDCADPTCQLACKSVTPPPPPPSGLTPSWPSCAQKNGDRSHTPVDIIWVVDSSFSMSDEMSWIQQNMNEFVEYLTQVTLDVRVVVLGGKDICVPEPLGGPNCGSGPRYLHVNDYVGSHDGLRKIIDLYPKYNKFIRPRGKKVLIMTSDDNSEVDAGWFNAAVRALSTPGFADGFIFHSIVSYGTHPKGCLTGAAPGRVYLELTEQTNGVKMSICQTDWTAIFSQLSTSVMLMVDLPCGYRVEADEIPPDGALNPAQLQVNTANARGTWSTLEQRGSAAECAQGGYYFEAATNTVHLCPETCQSPELKQVEVFFGCIEDIG